MDIISEEKNRVNKKRHLSRRIKKTLSKAGRSVVKKECREIIKTDDSEQVVTQTPFTARQLARRSTNFFIESATNKIVATAY